MLHEFVGGADDAARRRVAGGRQDQAGELLAEVDVGEFEGAAEAVAAKGSTLAAIFRASEIHKP